jgi:hypothetical protein
MGKLMLAAVFLGTAYYPDPTGWVEKSESIPNRPVIYYLYRIPDDIQYQLHGVLG